jgi:pyrimidine deaminase RibD-like protein
MEYRPQLSNRDQAYLSVARYLAEKSTSNKKHGAVLVKGGRVMGTGFNKDRNNPHIVSPEHIKSDCSYHAEELALREAGDNCKGAILYVARVNRQGNDRISKPCPKCQNLIEENRIKRVVYTQ